MTSLGEMHVRQGHYIGVAPVPGGLTNACLVVPGGLADLPFAQPADALHKMLHADPELSARFAKARAAAAPVMLGPMAVDASAAGEPGLLLAGDAAGFIDPMTGDGLRFALRGAELAAAIVKEVFDGSLSLGSRAPRAFGASPSCLPGKVAIQSRAAIAGLVAVERDGGGGDRHAAAIVVFTDDPICRGLPIDEGLEVLRS